jgi:ABC-type branched-subunit amino acid transport system substrate-binding protein
MGSLADVLLRHLRSISAKKIGVVKGELAYFNGLLEELRKRLRQDESLTIVDSLQSEESSFKTTLAKLRGKQYDVLGVFLVSGQISQFYREMRQFSLKVDTIGTDFFDSMNEVKQSQGAMAGAVFAAPWIDASFIETYKERYGNDVQVAWAANGYEFAKLTGRLFGNEDQKLSADEIIKRYTSNKDEQGSSSRFKYEESADGSGFDFKTVARRVEADRIVDIAQ